MARPAPPTGWNVINSNKPNEYSSEWDNEGRRYATVTDVSTGQRWLYGVNPVGVPGLVSGGRTLISTTDASGKVTEGRGFTTIKNSGGAALYNNLNKLNKNQSAVIIGSVGTDAEKQKVSGTTEYKGTNVGQNVSKDGVEKADLTDPNNQLFGTGQVRGDDVGLPGAGAAALKYPLDMSSQQDHIEFKMMEYSPRGLTGATDQGGGTQISGFAERRNATTAASKGVVVLPIVGGVSDLNTTGWGSGDMSPIDAAAASVFLTGLKNGIGEAIGNAEQQVKTATSDPGAAGQVKTAIASILTDAAINKPGTLAKTTGAIINPNTELLFNGVTLRPFTFTFKMSARSKPEAEVIKKIIFFFKKGMSAKRTKQGLFLKSPNTFLITYKHGANDHDAMNKIKECALLSCTVNYVPDGQYAAHSDGNLTSYEMQLQFTELEPVFFDDYDGKHSIGY